MILYIYYYIYSYIYIYVPSGVKHGLPENHPAFEFDGFLSEADLHCHV